MIISLVLVLFATACGVVATYLYDPHATFGTRLCTGVCIGMAGLGLICFVFAMFLGLTVPAIILTTIVLALPLVALNNPVRRQLIQQDVRETYRTVLDALLNPTKANATG